MNKNTVVIGLSIVIAGVLIAIAIVVGPNIMGNKAIDSGSDNNINSTSTISGGGLEIGNAPVLGDINAPVTIVEFEDFQCPYCEKLFTGAMSQIRDEYVKTGKVKIVFKTLAFLDYYDKYSDPQESKLSGFAGECSKEQGKFWAMHDLIYTAEGDEASTGVQPENSGNLTRDFFKNSAIKLGLDVDAFEKCMASDAPAKQLAIYEKDSQLEMPDGISTPTLFINGQKVEGALPFSQFKTIIDGMLQK